MIEHNCRTCLFYDTCHRVIACDNYTPYGEDAEEDALNTYIEDRRLEFYDEWRQYISED